MKIEGSRNCNRGGKTGREPVDAKQALKRDVASENQDRKRRERGPSTPRMVEGAGMDAKIQHERGILTS